jgi:hypothetical protein
MDHDVAVAAYDREFVEGDKPDDAKAVQAQTAAELNAMLPSILDQAQCESGMSRHGSPLSP